MIKMRTMRTLTATLALGWLCLAMPAPQLSAQETAADQAPADAVPLRVQITVSRFKGEALTSSLPFELLVNANVRGQTMLNNGVDVPVPQGDGKYTYRRIGNNISCSGATYEGGRIALLISIEDSSINTDAAEAGTHGPGLPTFRSFQTVTNVSMREGETLQFALATDKQTGEVLKVSVTARPVK